MIIQLIGSSSQNIKFSITSTLEKLIIQASPKDQGNLSTKFLTSPKGELRH